MNKAEINNLPQDYIPNVTGNDILDKVVRILDKGVEGMDEDTFIECKDELYRVWRLLVTLSAENSTLKDRIVELGGR